MAERALTNKVRAGLRSLRRRGETPPADGAADEVGPGLLADAGLEPPARADRSVIILTQGDTRTPVVEWLSEFAGDRLHVISLDADPEWDLDGHGATHHRAETLDQYHWLLKPIGPVDVLIDLLPVDDATHLLTWQRLFLHLRPGGLWLVDRRGQGQSAFTAAFASWVQTMVAAGGTEDVGANARDLELGASTAQVSISRDLLVIKKRRWHFLKLRDAETNRVLESREPNLRMRELAGVKGGELIIGSKIISHESTVPIPDLNTTLTYPELHLRHYTGKIAYVSNALVHGESTILPDSFRHHLEASPRNVRVNSISAAWGRIRQDLRPKDALPGHYYQLDCENPGHFGHLMTEVISRLWGWDAAKAEIPDLKALFRIRFPHERDPALERRLFTAYGIDEDDIVWADHPVYVESLVAATPQFHNQRPHYVHPGLIDTWRRIGEKLINRSVETHDQIFISRQDTLSNRVCRNAREVERWFADHGFTIIYPETLDLGEQAGIFAGARVIAGFGGSALFNAIHAEKLETLIILNHESYTARNEHLISALLDCDVHYFWSKSDVAHPPGGWSEEAYYSSWEFDFDHNRAEVEKLLAEL
ncbi:glycosyltransferase family 61 protein [Microlunatus parietis]|uniref:Capsular polysaccharide biosynthesis protein n=1 Tax=Microlunatus parietis TaxID=682979 RepID=A0A7Y9IEM2_9ACTN|nr:glycosyltransferase 61 family protein [Microlunatus parietis]NYE75528.1 capsular polysaccharide biosynthesis protein [Microlunatus parietis]